MLLIFSISMAPKTFFHDLVSDHKDSNCPEKHDSAVLHQKEHHCHFDNAVVNIPFLMWSTAQTELVISYSVKEVSEYQTLFFQSCFLNKENRGPPFASTI